MSSLSPWCAWSQADTIKNKLSFTGDFRFRVEPDWSSRKPDGTYREDRTRLRYRMRFGFQYQYNSQIQFGARIRTGNPIKQQDPQLTLGDGFKEFNTLPIGFEKLYFNFDANGFNFWLGKNTYPFTKQNELFWSDNVFPEGIFLAKRFPINSNFIQQIKVSGGHFIVGTNGTSLKNDRYFQGLQLTALMWDKRVEFFPALYNFHQMPNIPDGFETFNFDYLIAHLGFKIRIVQKPQVMIGIDYYNNLENLAENDSISDEFKQEKSGLVSAVSVGRFEEKGDWFFRATYMYLERYSAVDFLAQNDWARWDYQSFGSPDGRLTNYQGLELMIGYVISKNLKVNSRFFRVEQLVPFGAFKETGSRIRFDVDIGF